MCRPRTCSHAGEFLRRLGLLQQPVEHMDVTSEDRERVDAVARNYIHRDRQLPVLRVERVEAFDDLRECGKRLRLRVAATGP